MTCNLGNLSFSGGSAANLPNNSRALLVLTRSLRSLPESAQQVIVGEVIDAQSESEKTLTSTQVGVKLAKLSPSAG